MKILNTLLISLLAYSASAQVGIGTSDPTVPLDIEAADAAIDINNTSTDPLIHFQVSGTTHFTIGTDVTDSKFKIGTTALETGTAVTVQPTGEVGIGTTSPTEILTVSGGNILLKGDGAYIEFHGGGKIKKTIGEGFQFITHSDAEITNFLNAAGTTSHLAIKHSNGNVGIGTASPEEKLHISGSLKMEGNTFITTSSTLRLKTDDSDACWLQYENEGTSGTGIIDIITRDSHGEIKTRNSRALVFNNASGGNVGIGRDPATNDLEVEGTASKTTSGDWLANSDSRLKKEIKQMDSQTVLDKMLALKGVTYYWNDTVTGSKRPTQLQYGFTAQNIQEVFPILVEEDNLGYLQTAYGTYDAMYVESMRALQEQIDSQQVVIEAQKKEIATEKAENESQKQEIETIKAEASSAKIISIETAQKLAALEAKLNALLLLNSKSAVLTAEN